MATSSLPHPAAILADVESFFDALPAKRRRSRLDLDITPEIENYGATNTPKVVVTCELNRDAWLIEVKDYRFDARPKVGELVCALSRKVRDTMFLLRAASVAAPSPKPEFSTDRPGPRDAYQPGGTGPFHQLPQPIAKPYAQKARHPSG